MRKERTTFSPEFKMQVVLESFSPAASTAQLAKKYAISVKNICNWKQHFLSNAHLAFETTHHSHESIERLKSQNKELETLLIKRKQERDEGIKKLRALDISTKKQLIETSNKALSIVQQCKLIGLNRPSLYYVPKPVQKKDDAIRARILEILQTAQGACGYRKVHQQLLKDGHKIGVNKVHKLMKMAETEANALPTSNRHSLQNDPLASTHLLHDLPLAKPFKI